MKIKKDLLKKNIGIIIIVITYFIGSFYANPKVVSTLIIFLIGLGILKVIKSSFEIKIVIIFIIQYLYCFLEYFLLNKQLSVYLEYNQFNYIYQAAMLNYLFTGIFFMSLKNIEGKKIGIPKKQNTILFILNLLIFLYFILTSATGTIGTYSNIRLNTKAEYSLIPYLLLNSFSNKRQLIFINIFYFLFAIYLILIGSRVTGIQIIFTMIILERPSILFSENKKNKLKQNMKILYIILGITIMKLVEKIRNMDGNFIDRIHRVINLTKNNRVIVNNEADVIYATTALLGLIDNKILSYKESFKSLIAMLSNFLYIPYLTDMSNIPKLVQKYTPMGGGGLTAGFLYYLGREVLIVIGACFLGNTISKFFTTKNENMRIYIILLIATVFRWYPYGLSNIYKLALYGSIWYFLNMKAVKIFTIRKK